MSRQPSIWGSPVLLLAFGFGSGLSPRAPGTAGSLLAWLLFLPFTHAPTLMLVAVVLLALVFGVWLCGQASVQLGVHDHGGIVWDEFVGLWLTLLWTPREWPWLLLGLVLFRIFDILKPWPIKWADSQVEGGLGIMLDDVLAGIMAAACIQALLILPI